MTPAHDRPRAGGQVQVVKTFSPTLAPAGAPQGSPRPDRPIQIRPVQAVCSRPPGPGRLVVDRMSRPLGPASRCWIACPGRPPGEARTAGADRAAGWRAPARIGYMTPGPRDSRPANATTHGPVAQWIEQQPSKLKVPGSNPGGVANSKSEKSIVSIQCGRRVRLSPAAGKERNGYLEREAGYSGTVSPGKSPETLGPSVGRPIEGERALGPGGDMSRRSPGSSARSGALRTISHLLAL